MPHTLNEDSPIAALLSLILLSGVLVTGRCFHNGPYEAAELSRDGGDGDVEMLFVAQVIEPPRETMLSLQRDGHYLWGLSLLAHSYKAASSLYLPSNNTSRKAAENSLLQLAFTRENGEFSSAIIQC